MKDSIIILLFFMTGILLGRFNWYPGNMDITLFTRYALYFLLVLVGITIGMDKRVWVYFRRLQLKILLVPLGTIVGSAIGAIFYSMIYSYPDYIDALAISAGYGYYSLSSIMITELAGKSLGLIALLSNITREIFTLLAAPLLSRFFGQLAPVTSGGATSMDTTLPVILKHTSPGYSIIAITHGIILSIFVPVIISILYKLS
ncbi:MAG: lysine exporter LysO family protein [Bacteroidota bacterium]